MNENNTQLKGMIEEFARLHSMTHQPLESVDFELSPDFNYPTIDCSTRDSLEGQKITDFGRNISRGVNSSMADRYADACSEPHHSRYQYGCRAGMTNSELNGRSMAFPQTEIQPHEPDMLFAARDLVEISVPLKIKEIFDMTASTTWWAGNPDRIDATPIVDESGSTTVYHQGKEMGYATKTSKFFAGNASDVRVFTHDGNLYMLFPYLFNSKTKKYETNYGDDKDRFKGNQSSFFPGCSWYLVEPIELENNLVKHDLIGVKNKERDKPNLISEQDLYSLIEKDATVLGELLEIVKSAHAEREVEELTPEQQAINKLGKQQNFNITVNNMMTNKLVAMWNNAADQFDGFDGRIKTLDKKVNNLDKKVDSVDRKASLALDIANEAHKKIKNINTMKKSSSSTGKPYNPPLFVGISYDGFNDIINYQ
jgi:hypothetical protein